jgi:glycosyltransferase involved in cell wall biosynthesis
MSKVAIRPKAEVQQGEIGESPQRLRIALIVSSLSGGGAERVISTLTNVWAGQGHSVFIVTYTDIASDAYELHPAVTRLSLNAGFGEHGLLRSISANTQRVVRLGKLLRGIRADAAISFMTTTNIIATIVCRTIRVPIIISERVSILDHPPTGIWKFLYRPVYRRASAIVAQTRENADALFSILRRPVEVIWNPTSQPMNVPMDRLAADVLQEVGDRQMILAAGRLVRQKGFDLLIEAFGSLGQAREGWVLVILGDGPERQGLSEQVARAGLERCILMPGYVPAPGSFMRNSHIFVLSSRFEGMPNALMEAMSEGLACISFDCRTGPRELIEDGVNGILVEAENALKLAAAMADLMADAGKRQQLGRAAQAPDARSDPGTVAESWIDLLRSAIDRPLRNG